MGEMKDITGSEEVEIKIRADGKVIWVNTAEEAAVLRICKINKLLLVDERKIFTNEIDLPNGIKEAIKEEVNTIEEVRKYQQTIDSMINKVNERRNELIRSIKDIKKNPKEMRERIRQRVKARLDETTQFKKQLNILRNSISKNSRKTTENTVMTKESLPDVATDETPCVSNPVSEKSDARDEDKRTPILEKVACYHWQGTGCVDFSFFEKDATVKDGDVFIYNEGVLFKLKRKVK